MIQNLFLSINRKFAISSGNHINPKCLCEGLTVCGVGWSSVFHQVQSHHSHHTLCFHGFVTMRWLCLIGKPTQLAWTSQRIDVVSSRWTRGAFQPNNADQLKAVIKSTWAATPLQCHQTIASMHAALMQRIIVKKLQLHFTCKKLNLSETGLFCIVNLF